MTIRTKRDEILGRGTLSVERANFVRGRAAKYEQHLARLPEYMRAPERVRLLATLEIEATMAPGDALTYVNPDGSVPSPPEIMARGLLPTIVRKV